MFFVTYNGLTLLKSHLLSQFSQINHCFTTRRGGFSKNGCSEFNISLNVGDNPQAVGKNRKLLTNVLKAKWEMFTYANQILGNKVIEATSKANEGADGIVTNQKDYILLTQSADCVLILIFDPIKQVIANIHASWRGTLGEIAKNGVSKMSQIADSNPSNLVAAISPAIGSCCYEIKDDVASLFRKSFQYANKFITYKNKRMFLDLPNMNKHQLIERGVKSQNIETSNLCTKCNEGLFYSYRRDGEKTGRFAGIIFLR